MNAILDAARTQVFAEQALGMVNGGFLSLMMSTGHRTGHQLVTQALQQFGHRHLL